MMNKQQPRIQHENADVIGETLGDWGRWQFRTVLLIFLCKIPACWCMTIVIFTAPAPRQLPIVCSVPVPINTTITSAASVNSSESLRLPLQSRYGNDRMTQQQTIVVMHPTFIVPNDKQFDIDYCDVRNDMRAHADVRHVAAHTAKSRSSSSSRLNALDDNEDDGVDDATMPCDALAHRPFYHLKETTFDVICSRNLVAAFTQFFHLAGVVSGGLIALALMTLYE